jgi:hypothetical protein
MTKTAAAIAVLLAFVGTTLAFGQDGNGPPTESIVVPAEGVTDFTVTGRSTLFRLSVETIAGGSIEKPVVTGSAKHIRTEEITTAGKDGENLIGGLNQHFVFRGTGAGKAKIVINYKAPTSPDVVTKTYNVTIK